MHGWGWGWHRDHHEPHSNLLEKNDLYALVGAGMSISMFAVGSPWVMGGLLGLPAWAPGTWIGLGILGYGIIYTLVHDGLVHQRYFRWVPRRGYARRLVQALTAADRVLQVDAESEDGHHQRLLALRELGRPAEAAEAERRYLYYRRPVEQDQALRQQFRAREPERVDEDVLAHTHTLRLATGAP